MTGQEWSRITVPREDGTRFTVTVTSAHPESAVPDSPVVLIVPAMGMRASYYPPLLQALQDAGVRAAVMELRGHEVEGGRRAGRNYNFGYASMVADLAEALDVVEGHFGAGPTYLLGHSMGGHLSSVYAAAHPDQIAGLILVATGTPHWRVVSPRLLPMSHFAVALSRTVGHFPGERVGFAGREARGVMRDWGRLVRTGRFTFGRPRVDYTDQIAAWTGPILALSFVEDKLTPRQTLDAMVALFSRSRVTRVHLDPATDGIDGIDHFRWARYPQTVLPEILRWFAFVRPDTSQAAPAEISPSDGSGAG